MAYSIRDDRKRELVFARPPKRVVSLVPSDTYTLEKLLGREAIVGRTDYCDLKDVPSVGGTKDYSVEKVLDLKPDVVIANQEENTKQTLEKLAQEAIAVFVVFPKRVEDGVALVARYARLFRVEGELHVKELVRGCHRALEAQRAIRQQKAPIRAFCPIWMDPLMTVHGDTFISDSLDLAGAQNIFADRERRYPLAADLGKRAPIDPGQRDTRYPRVTFDEMLERKPDVVLLPDEPHPFSEDDANKFRALGLKNVVHLNGRDVCWYGAWSAEGIPRLAQTIASVAAGIGD
jgi:ABC-type Fe3+-hydroxamate transport system substrate-binding protein